MACGGLHCAGCGGGAGVPLVALLALEGGAWVAAHIIEVAAVSAACAALSVAAVVWLMRWQDRRQAAFAARGSLFTVRADAIPAPPKPQVTQGTQPAIEQRHIHFHFDPADREALRVIRSALPAETGTTAITEE